VLAISVLVVDGWPTVRGRLKARAVLAVSLVSSGTVGTA
jgi:hypothetical protein